MNDFFKIEENLYYFPYKKLFVKTLGNDENLLCEALNCYEDKVERFEWKSYARRHFLPRNAYLLVSDACNCGCLYCYADAKNEGKLMHFDVAKATVDFLFINALIHKQLSTKSSVSVRFMGGGEPTINYKLIKKITSYIKEKSNIYDVQSEISLQTNGQFEDAGEIEWLSTNMKQVTISMDGLENIQNLQRPRRDGKDSFGCIDSFINLFSKRNNNISVRATVTQNSIDEIPQFIDWLIEKGVKQLHVEPMAQSGRANKQNILESPSPNNFATHFLEWQRYALHKPIRIYSSLDVKQSITSQKNSICEGILGNSIFVNPYGDVSACTEMTQFNDDCDSIYKIGYYSKSTDKIVMDEKKRNVDLSIFANCENCIAYKHCFGCYVRHANQNSYFCDIKKLILMHRLKDEFLNISSIAVGDGIIEYCKELK